MFFMMKELSGILRNSRHHRGSIDFDFPESKIILNAAGKAIDVKPYEANVATKIIEDFMLMANETVAQEYCTEEIPFVYRTHDNPDPEKVESLLTLLHNQGVKIQKAKEEITPKEIQHDIAIIYGEKTTYILCVMSENCPEGTAVTNIQNISKIVYNYLNL